jgi:hypothetical protein
MPCGAGVVGKLDGVAEGSTPGSVAVGKLDGIAEGSTTGSVVVGKLDGIAEGSTPGSVAVGADGWSLAASGSRFPAVLDPGGGRRTRFARLARFAQTCGGPVPPGSARFGCTGSSPITTDPGVVPG